MSAPSPPMIMSFPRCRSANRPSVRQAGGQRVVALATDGIVSSVAAIEDDHCRRSHQYVRCRRPLSGAPLACGRFIQMTDETRRLEIDPTLSITDPSLRRSPNCSRYFEIHRRILGWRPFVDGRPSNLTTAWLMKFLFFVRINGWGSSLRNFRPKQQGDIRRRPTRSQLERPVT